MTDTPDRPGEHGHHEDEPTLKHGPFPGSAAGAGSSAEPPEPPADDPRHDDPRRDPDTVTIPSHFGAAGADSESGAGRSAPDGGPVGDAPGAGGEPGQDASGSDTAGVGRPGSDADAVSRSGLDGPAVGAQGAGSAAAGGSPNGSAASSAGGSGPAPSESGGSGGSASEPGDPAADLTPPSGFRSTAPFGAGDTSEQTAVFDLPGATGGRGPSAGSDDPSGSGAYGADGPGGTGAYRSADGPVDSELPVIFRTR